MKKTMLLLLLLSPGPVMAQTTNPAVAFTNRFATFTNLQGKAYERVELVRADAFSVLYRTGSGAGRVFFTNLAPSVLGGLGFDTNSAQTAARLEEELNRKREGSRAEELERSLNPDNWKEVHVRELVRSYGGGVECSVQEFSRRVILRNAPPALLDYWNQRQTLLQTSARLNAAIQEARAQIQTLTSETTAFAAELNDREIRQQWQEATIVPVTYEDPLLAQSQINRATAIQRARVELNLDKQELTRQQQQLANVELELPQTQEQLSTVFTQLKKLEEDGAKLTVLRVFVSSGTYLGIPVLVFKQFALPRE
ncbi:MAG: hypothetical protein U1F65_01820 [Verrucomicrobiota bacterium]